MKMSDVISTPIHVNRLVSDWFDEDGDVAILGNRDREAVAHAVNCHDDLVEALRLTRACDLPPDVFEAVDAALSKAEASS